MEHEKSVTLDTALGLLRQKAGAEPDDFRQGASEQEIVQANATLPSPLPLAWQRVLRVSIGFDCLAEYEERGTVPVAQIYFTDKDGRKFLDRLASPLPIIGGTSNAGVYVLAVDQETTEGDCPVLYLEHSSDFDHSWPDVGAFLHQILEEDEADEDQEADGDEDEA